MGKTAAGVGAAIAVVAPDCKPMAEALVGIATCCSVFSGVPSARSLTAVLSSTWWVGPVTVTDCGLIFALMAPPWPCPSLQLPATVAVTELTFCDDGVGGGAVAGAAPAGGAPRPMMAAVVVAAMATRLIHMVLPFDGVNDGRWVTLSTAPRCRGPAACQEGVERRGARGWCRSVVCWHGEVVPVVVARGSPHPEIAHQLVAVRPTCDVEMYLQWQRAPGIGVPALPMGGTAIGLGAHHGVGRR